MTREEVKQFLISRGWIEDRWGNLKPPNASGIRIKLNKNSLRVERRRSWGAWERLRSNYYKHLYVTTDGKLGGLK